MSENRSTKTVNAKASYYVRQATTAKQERASHNRYTKYSICNTTKDKLQRATGKRNASTSIQHLSTCNRQPTTHYPTISSRSRRKRPQRGLFVGCSGFLRKVRRRVLRSLEAAPRCGMLSPGQKQVSLCRTGQHFSRLTRGCLRQRICRCLGAERELSWHKEEVAGNAVCIQS